MEKAIYSATSGMVAQEKRLEIIANNMANINTTSFKKEVPIFQEYLSKAIKIPSKPTDTSFVDICQTYRDFSQGRLISTHRNLDFAIEGKGFFVVEKTPTEYLYTRNGHFFIDKNGYLVTNEGYKVLSLNGPIQIKGKNITLSSDGILTTELGERFNLRIVDFANLQALLPKGNSYYEYTGPGQDIKNINNPSLYQGFLEGSNVHLIKEMVDLIQTNRIFQSYQKLIKTRDDDERMLMEKLK